MTAENRRHVRYSVEVAAELTYGSNTIAAATQNVSEGGVGLLLDRPVEDGARIDVVLFLTQDGIEDPDEEPFEAPAEVAWSAPSDSGTYLAGVRFGALSEEQRSLLRRFLSAIAE